ncbi:DUF5004 domain-containing protein [Marseilla massiliensis]|uniref:DUF5004 domain-containing protein n=1 Tax=Marseilla massiliensis TaxID=1841864 RepID=UPI0030C7D42C
MRKHLLTKLLVPLLLVATNILLISCNTVEDGGYVAPITLYEKVAGHWMVNSVTQTDELESTKMPITDLFDFDTFGINLSVDENNNPANFMVEGNAPAIIPVSGTWKMANPFINSDGSSADIVLNDGVHLTLTSVPGTNPVLEFKFTRSQNGKPFVSYTYNLTPTAMSATSSNNE